MTPIMVANKESSMFGLLFVVKSSPHTVEGIYINNNRVSVTKYIDVASRHLNTASTGLFIYLG